MTHEHDLRAALGRPGARDHETVRALADRLGGQLASTPVPVAVDLGDRVVGAVDAALCLHTDDFELVRLRMGRRSRAQVLALDWSDDPTEAMADLFVFGPASHDLEE